MKVYDTFQEAKQAYDQISYLMKTKRAIFEVDGKYQIMSEQQYEALEWEEESK